MTTAATAIPIADFDGNSNGGETDHLAGAVLRALGRSFRNQFSLSPSGAFWMALISFGFWPLWKMARQFRDYQSFEKQQFWHLAEWLRVRRGDREETVALHAQIDRLRPGGGLVTTFFWLICQIAVIASIVNILGDNFSVNRLVDSTWRTHHPWSHAALVWKPWVIGLGLAYVLQMVRVTMHHRAVSKIVDRFNAVLWRENVATVAMPEMEGGVIAGWWWTAGILSWMGGLWAIPMALAGAAQRRYINGSSARLRADMLERVRTMLHQQRPAVAVPQYAIHSRRCGNNLCRGTLRANASFCPRCGTSAQLMSEVA
jgi:hypothetical protein